MPRAVIASLLTLALLAACGGSDDKAAPSPTPTPKVPTEAEVKAVFLTEAEVGEKFTGGPPNAESKNQGGKDPKPLCGIKTPKSALNLSALFSHESRTTQVYENISVYDAGGAEEHIAVRRRQSEAACEYDEAVGETKYHVKVGGPIPDFPSFGDASFGHVVTFTGGYVGKRYSMIAKIGLTALYMEYTATEFDADFGVDVFRKAVDKAASLA